MTFVKGSFQGEVGVTTQLRSKKKKTGGEELGTVGIDDCFLMKRSREVG